MLRAVGASLEARTGRSLSEWVAEVARAGLDPLAQKVVRRWLKELGIGQNSAWAIADAAARAAGYVAPDLEETLAVPFSGPRAERRPLFDQLRAGVLACGPDVRIEARATYIPFVRARQFLAVKVRSERLELGLRYLDAPKAPALGPGGPGQATHRLVLVPSIPIDGPVLDLRRLAYDQNG